MLGDDDDDDDDTAAAVLLLVGEFLTVMRKGKERRGKESAAKEVRRIGGGREGDWKLSFQKSTREKTF